MHENPSTHSAEPTTPPGPRSVNGLALVMRHRRKLFTAAKTAFLALWKIKPRRRALSEAVGLLLFLRWSILTTREKRGQRSVSDSQYNARLLACRACELFNPTTETCGTAGETYHNPLTLKPEPLGCWCYMPVKAAFLSNCWAWRKGLDIGWPAELNTDHEQVAPSSDH